MTATATPNVTARVTKAVLLLARWIAADLFLRDISRLTAELSMQKASPELMALVGESDEPYRVLMKQLRARLRKTRAELQNSISSGVPVSTDIMLNTDELLTPLLLCHRSLHECGMGLIADGDLLDTIRRTTTFGLSLVRLDIRQDAERHTSALMKSRNGSV